MVSQKPKYYKNFERNSHWSKLSMIMMWERYCNASPKPEFFLFSLFIFSFISQLIWVCLGWNFHILFSIQKQVNWLYNWSFLFVVLHKPSWTLLPSTFKPSKVLCSHICALWTCLYYFLNLFLLSPISSRAMAVSHLCVIFSFFIIVNWMPTFFKEVYPESKVSYSSHLLFPLYT